MFEGYTTNNTPSSSSIIQSQNINTNTLDISNIQEGKAQTLSDIAELQNIEKGYFSTLESGLTQESISPQEKDDLVQKINQISQMRTNLYKNLNGMYSFYQSNISSTRDTLEEQSAAIDIVENELNEAKRRMKMIDEDKSNKLRLVEINSYYGEQYADHTQIMKIVIMICIPVLFLSILFNRGMLSNEFYTIFMVLVMVIGLIFLGSHLFRTLYKDNMNYQRNNYFFDTKNAPQINTGVISADPWTIKPITCVGSACCDNVTNYYDDVAKICIPIHL